MTKEDLKQLIQEVYEEEMAETKKKGAAKEEPKKEAPKAPKAPVKKAAEAPKAEDPSKITKSFVKTIDKHGDKNKFAGDKGDAELFGKIKKILTPYVGRRLEEADIDKMMGEMECDECYEEGAKPDFLDLDKDGNKTEPMKKAAKDSKLKHEVVANVLGKLKEAGPMSPEDKKATDLEIQAQKAKIAAAQHRIQNLQKGDALTEGMERDYEGKMAKAQLISIVKNAKDLFDSMDDNTQLKAWIQSKLSKAEDYISSVRTYLDGESLTTFSTSFSATLITLSVQTTLPLAIYCFGSLASLCSLD